MKQAYNIRLVTRALIASSAAKVQLVNLETGTVIGSRDRFGEFTHFISFSTDDLCRAI